jgi:glutathione S-transferase
VRLYVEDLAPNVRRVRMVLAEKSLEIPLTAIDVQRGENRSPEFLTKNPFGQVPVLELPDGSCISESVAICRYLDELHPTPSLFGADARERAEVEMWQRRAEFGLFIPAVELGHHTSPFFREAMEQIPEWGPHCQALLLRTWQVLDHELSGREYLAPKGFSVADVTAFVGVQVAAFWGSTIPRDLKHVVEWHGRVARRPSAAAVRY